jgi:hypothetical protein
LAILSSGFEGATAGSNVHGQMPQHLIILLFGLFFDFVFVTSSEINDSYGSWRFLHSFVRVLMSE